MWSLSLVSCGPRRGAFEVISALMGGSTRWPLKLLLNTELRLTQWELAQWFLCYYLCFQIKFLVLKKHFGSTFIFLSYNFFLWNGTYIQIAHKICMCSIMEDSQTDTHWPSPKSRHSILSPSKACPVPSPDHYSLLFWEVSVWFSCSLGHGLWVISWFWTVFSFYINKNYKSYHSLPS